MSETSAITGGHSQPGKIPLTPSRVSFQAITPPRKHGAKYNMRNLSPKRGWKNAPTTQTPQRTSNDFSERFLNDRKSRGMSTYIATSRGKVQSVAKVGGNSGLPRKKRYCVSVRFCHRFTGFHFKSKQKANSTQTILNG